MSKIVRTVRFLAGTAMVAGGVSLAGPFVSSVVVAHSRSGRPDVSAAALAAPSMPDWSAAVPGGQPDGPPVQQPVFAVSQVPGPNVGQLASAVAMAVPARADHRPPTPPPPLPAARVDTASPPPGLDPTYRSTLDIPPPPLLDAQAPPPLAVAWSAHDLRDLHAAQPSAFVAAQPAAAPSVYTVRDGDDLTVIATRLYGHPAAAAALWSANRDRLTSPDLLPIGLQLRVPPAWTVAALQPGRGHGGGQAIEPGPSIASADAGGRMPPPPAVGLSADDGGALAAADRGPTGWLGQPGAPAPIAVTATAFSPVVRAAPQQVAPSPFAGGSARPEMRIVRLGHGDTLVSLAERFYGDRAMADRIWEANRDRIRSPELLVPGMELRLP